MTLIPVLDPLACSAHGDCAAVAPGVFRVDDAAVVVGSGPPDLVMRAAESCPAVAIAVIDEDTGEQVYP
jgi:ferredoxin